MTVYWPNGSLSIPRVTSEFDAARKNPVTGIVQPHNGIDLIGWTDNCSPVDGTVIFAGYNGGAGNEVRIRADGPTAFHVGDCFRILHHASLYVSTGQRVSARQPVGRMGTTGQSTGVHCHFETHERGLWNYVNPRDFMARANGGSSAGGGSNPFNPEEDMPLDNADLIRILTAEFNVPGVGTVKVLDALGKIYSIPGNVWTHPLEHTVAKKADGSALMTTAGDLLRFEPAEHANTRAAVALVATGDFDYERVAEELAERFPELDAHAFAVAAADEADRREKVRLAADVSP